MIKGIEINKIHPHPNNPRKGLGDITELAESIKANGIYQNLTVVPMDSELYQKEINSKKAYTGEYIAIIGHRRLAAAKQAGLKEVPCAISDMDEKKQVSTMLVENMQRNDLTVIEQAQGFQMMLDLGETTQTIAEKTGFSETTVRKRLFIASLDTKKSKSAHERGATLDDYMKLQKLTNEKKRNKVLESLGTHNFDYNLRNAIAEELRDRLAPQIIKQIEAFAKPTDKQSWELKGYQNCYNLRCSFEDYEKKGKLGFKIPTKCKPDEYLYHISSNSIEIYKKQENFKAGKKMSELPPEEQEERREKRRKYKALKEMGEITYQLRLDFVKSFAQKSALNIVQLEALSEFAFASVCLGEKFDFNYYASLEGLEVENAWRMNYSQKKEVMKKAKTPVSRILLASLYSAFRDSAENTYFYGTEASVEKRGYHKGNGKLDAIYDCLCALGYRMSDEEQALRDGTHELFIRNDGGQEEEM